MHQIAKVVLLVAVVGTALVWSKAGRGEPGKARQASVTAAPVKPLPAAPRQELLKADVPYHGVSWQIHSSEGCVQSARELLGQIADLGADAVLISNAGYQEHAGSESFKIDPKVTPSPEQWKQIFKIAHDSGLRVILMPIILLSDPRGTEWRGVISPPSWDDWFAQYRKFILHFARIAEENNVEVMTVGSELVSTEKYTDQWRKVVQEVRKVYHGKLSYSANWDHYKVVEFWDDLDLVGMTSYYKLSDEPNPSMETLLEAWKPIKRGLLKWQEEIGKPLVFTEVGWCSQEGASIEPWNYYYKQKATSGGLEEQRRCYKAFMETWSHTPQVGGIIWWEWTNTAGGTDDFNYIPRGKPAELELRRWFAAMRREYSAGRVTGGTEAREPNARKAKSTP